MFLKSCSYSSSTLTMALIFRLLISIKKMNIGLLTFFILMRMTFLLKVLNTNILLYLSIGIFTLIHFPKMFKKLLSTIWTGKRLD